MTDQSIIVPVPRDKISAWLYYETGFEQMHPVPEIQDWMAEQGYVYGKDWDCIRTEPGMVGYHLLFPDQDTATLFLLRWS